MKLIVVFIVQISASNEIQHSETIGKIKEFRILEINWSFEIKSLYAIILKILLFITNAI